METTYRILSIDAFKPELTVFAAYNGVTLMLSPKGSSSDFLKKHSIKEDMIDHLKDEFMHYNIHHYSYDGDNSVLYIFAGVSGPIQIYSDTDIDGREAGEDLSDLFECYSLGRIKYPEMDVIPDQHLLDAQASHKAPNVVAYDCNEYYSEGVLPIIGLGEPPIGAQTIQIKKQYSYLLESPFTFHVTIPITGLDKDGNEIGMVLTATNTTNNTDW